MGDWPHPDHIYIYVCVYAFKSPGPHLRHSWPLSSSIVLVYLSSNQGQLSQDAFSEDRVL